MKNFTKRCRSARRSIFINMTFIEKIHQNAGRGWLLAAGGLVLALLLAVNARVTRQLSDLEKDIKIAEEAGRRSSVYAEELRSARERKAKAARDVKAALTDMAAAKKMIYEAGLSLQEEKRLLEKQLEIMTTYLELDGEAAKIHLMRGDQTLKSFGFSAPLRALGGEKPATPELCRITAKERFASPERGKAEKTAAGLNWEPPQTGRSRRDSPLGEYVIFTDGPLILHAPVPNAALHNAYPHLCAGLTLYSAKRLYESVFIGNKLLIKVSVPAKPPPPRIQGAKKKK